MAADNKPAQSLQTLDEMAPPEFERLRVRFQNEICTVCVHRMANGGCSLTRKIECPIYRWSQELVHVVKDVHSLRLQDYEARLQTEVCPSCNQLRDGRCTVRDHLDCPLDLYLGMVVPIVEEEVSREGADSHEKSE